MSLLGQLKQRKVFRVAAAYAVLAWLLLQVVSVVFPTLQLPAWTVTFTTILLLLGFPVALLLAWSFDVVRDRGGTPAMPTVAPAGARTVVVLPFANMSDDAAQVHFADGLVEDILTRLQRVSGLKVMSRQSSFAYKGRSVDTRTIARELGCRYIVEGSVRRIDERLRVTVQLIDAADDQHLWAERYDRELTDTFAMQDEICEQVVAAIESLLVKGPTETSPLASTGSDGTPLSHARPVRSARTIAGTWWAIPAIGAVIGMAALLTWTWQQRGQERWAREVAMPQLLALVAKDDYDAAFDLAREIGRVIPNDPQLRALEPQFAAPVKLVTNPAGAKVFYRPFHGTEANWRFVGETPLESAPMPRGVGLWRIEHADRDPMLRAYRNPGIELQASLEPDELADFKGFDFALQLANADTTPKDMVLVPASNRLVTLVSDNKPVELPAFYLDRYEVTNRQFKEFVDAGGYREAAHWQDLPFGNSVESWQEAAARFVDTTGRPGPATWQSGTYPDGTGDYPVAGVSWFEAMAYARFRGKELPTAFHWYRAAYSLNEFFDSISSAVVTRSNYTGKATAPVGKFKGIGPYGTYDMAGNVREWLWTAIGNTREVAGGAWNEPPYLYNEIDSADPWDRSPGNGFRCMRTLGGGPTSSALRGPIGKTKVDFAALKPVDDAAYAILEAQLHYLAADLQPRVDKLPSRNPGWSRERISLATGYDPTRFNVQLFLPVDARPPYQAVIYLPHSGHFKYAQSSDEFDPTETNQPLDFIMKSGRALVVITFDGSFERRWPDARLGSMSREDRYRVRLQHHRQDLGRTIDYLATRADIDAKRLGVLGISYGAQTMMPLLAAEKRIGPAVLIGGGIFLLEVAPGEEPYNYLPHIEQPVLMLSGRWDIDVNVESQEAMLRMLGTPAARKQRILFDAGHGWLPQNQFVRASLDWYDTYLGATR